jgi:hypothetical protein
VVPTRLTNKHGQTIQPLWSFARADADSGARTSFMVQDKAPPCQYIMAPMACQRSRKSAGGTSSIRTTEGEDPDITKKRNGVPDARHCHHASRLDLPVSGSKTSAQRRVSPVASWTPVSRTRPSPGAPLSCEHRHWRSRPASSNHRPLGRGHR